VRGRHWFLVLLLVAAVGAAAYAIGLPYVVVYVIRGVVRHLAYHHGG
jgi:hypothetical protein